MTAGSFSGNLLIMLATPKEAAGIKRAIAAVGLSALARVLGVTRQAVFLWQLNRIPAERVRAVVKATGGKVTAAELRPDLFG